MFTCSRVLPDAIGSFCEQGVARSDARIDMERYNEKCGVVGLYNVEQVPSASGSHAIVCFYPQCKGRNVFETIAALNFRAPFLSSSSYGCRKFWGFILIPAHSSES